MMYFSRYLRFTACLFLILSLASSCIREKLVLGEDRISVGDYLPEFEVSVNDGRQISTSNLSGKISVIVFFNTDCPDCRQLMPEIQKLYEMYSDAGDIVILAVSREQDYESVSGYWEKNNYSIPFSAQDGRQVYELFAMSGIPRVYIADSGLVVRSVFTDNNLPAAGDISRIIENLRDL